MIFVTVGTEKFPFDRLLRTIDEALKTGEINDEVFAQIGNCDYKPQYYKYEKMLPFQKIVEAIINSNIVVSHAGTGSIRMCLKEGKIPIVLARDAKYGEHLDNHQMQLAGKMEQLGKIILVRSETELIYSIKNYKKILNKSITPHYSNNITRIIEYLDKICQ
jgi:UDP-N-acetylglucosamine transferase subunit ALG13